MANEFEIKVLQTAENFVAYLPPVESDDGLVLFAAYKSKKDLADDCKLPRLPDAIEFVKSVYTGVRIGDECFDRVEGATYQKLKNGSWKKNEHPVFKEDLPEAFARGSLEAKTFEMLAQAARPLVKQI